MKPLAYYKGYTLMQDETMYAVFYFHNGFHQQVTKWYCYRKCAEDKFNHLCKG